MPRLSLRSKIFLHLLAVHVILAVIAFIVLMENRLWLLAVEVLSPSTAARDRGIKRRLYLEAGVEEYWIVDVDKHHVAVWTPEAESPHVETEQVTWSPPGNDEPFTVELAELF